MRKAWIILVLLFWTSGVLCGDVITVTPQVTFSPTQEPEKAARVLFRNSEKCFYFCSIKNMYGDLVRFSATGELGAGQHGINWDGKDASGKLVPEGEYRLFLSEGIQWECDRSFGNDGRIQFDKPRDPQTFFENPWSVALDDGNNLYVLLQCKCKGVNYSLGRLRKYTPDGKAVDKTFGKNGEIPNFYPASHVVISSEEKKIYLAGSHDWCHAVGVYSLDTGAPLYAIGGYAGGKQPETTGSVQGVCLGKGSKIYLRASGLKAYDRTKQNLTGFLHGSYPFKRHSGYTPLVHTYWGPCLAQAQEEDMFYTTTYYSDLEKFKDTGQDFQEVYYLQIPGNPVGISLDPKRNLVFAALRTVVGEVAVAFDTGNSLKEAGHLKDPALGPIHSVIYKDDYLYVVEDGVSPAGSSLEEMEDNDLPSLGQNRISRYRIEFGGEKQRAVIWRK